MIFRCEVFSRALLATSLIAGAASAEEDLFFSGLPVVASVSRLPQPLADVPTAVTVIDREMIRASGARDLNDVFRLVPGFQTYPNNTDAARVTYHGITDEEYSPRLQVLIDGRSQYSPLFRNGVNWATLPVAIEDIERIEVVRGSNAASYGTNAFLGVINIITVDPALTHGLSLSTNYGNQGVRDYTLRNGGRIGDVGDYRFTYQQKDDDGLGNRSDWIDSFSSKLFDVRADFQISERDSWQFGLGHVEAITQRGRLAKDPTGHFVIGGNSADQPIHDFSQSNTYLQIQWRRVLDADSDFQLRYSYVSDWASDRYVSRRSVSGTDYLFERDQFGGQGTRHEIEAQHNFSPLARTRLVWGLGWREDTLSSPSLLVGKGTVSRDVLRLFGNLEWKPVEWFTGNAGLSAEHDSLAGDHVSPRISANFHLNRENTLRLGYSDAYRTPGVIDKQGDETLTAFARADGLPFVGPVTKALFHGNPDLRPERMATLEAGYLGDWREQRMSLDVRVFDEHIANRQMQMYLNPDYVMAVQDIRMRGVEYTWKWQPLDLTKVMLNQTYSRINSDFLPSAQGVLKTLSAADRAHLDQLAEQASPRDSTSLLVIQKLPFGFEFSTAVYSVGSMKWTRNTSVGAYTRVDARLGYPFRLGRTSGEIAYTAQSLNGAHGEFKSDGKPADRAVEQRHWVTVRFDL
jgi:iron complex outermembrane receptor protein